MTGSDHQLAVTAAPLVRRIRMHSDIPILLGFDISKSSHVRQAMKASADGVISCSTLVKIIGSHAEAGLNSRGAVRAMMREIVEFVQKMNRRRSDENSQAFR